MPLQKTVPRLETLGLQHLSQLCAATCSRLEEDEAAPAPHADGNANGNPAPMPSSAAAFPPPRYRTKSELRFVQLLRLLPATLLEPLVSQVIQVVAGAIRKHRGHKGLLKALECLPQASLRRLDVAALFSEVRLYGRVNAQCKILLRASLQRLPRLTHLNLESKCNDEMLFELARQCPLLEDLQVTMSDISDRGLMALCGISVTGALDADADGCFKLVRLGLQNCINITLTGVGCALRNLPQLVTVTYDKLLDAVETVAKIDRDYVAGRRAFRVTHLDQYSDYYDFEAHPDALAILLKVCPRLESLRFYISDEGCKSLSQITGIRLLQLEMEDVGNGFRLLTRNYTNLVSLHLTFRTMPFSQLIDIADNCPQLAVLRLIGFEINDSHILVSSPHAHVFSRLRVIDVRMMRSDDDPFDELPADDDADAQDTITSQLMHFLLESSHALEELTVEAVAGFMGEAFLGQVLRQNPLSQLSKLCLNVSPAQALTARVARNLLHSLPKIHVIGLSRWNITNREIRAIMAEVKKDNLDVNFV